MSFNAHAFLAFRTYPQFHELEAVDRPAIYCIDDITHEHVAVAFGSPVAVHMFDLELPAAVRLYTNSDACGAEQKVRERTTGA